MSQEYTLGTFLFYWYTAGTLCVQAALHAECNYDSRSILGVHIDLWQHPLVTFFSLGAGIGYNWCPCSSLCVMGGNNESNCGSCIMHYKLVQISNSGLRATEFKSWYIFLGHCRNVLCHKSDIRAHFMFCVTHWVHFACWQFTLSTLFILLGSGCTHWVQECHKGSLRVNFVFWQYTFGTFWMYALAPIGVPAAGMWYNLSSCGTVCEFLVEITLTIFGILTGSTQRLFSVLAVHFGYVLVTIYVPSAGIGHHFVCWQIKSSSYSECYGHTTGTDMT